MTVGRLAVFYKQRDLYFYPAWAYAIPATILKVPLSMLVTLVWTSLTYIMSLNTVLRLEAHTNGLGTEQQQTDIDSEYYHRARNT
ncbi:unnamed protein product [Camellia sinensis]